MEELETLVRTRVEEIRTRIAAAARRSGRDPSRVALMAAVKTRAPEEVAATILAGVPSIGENRVQEGLAHLQALDAGLRGRCRLHFIGRLQANKARKALQAFDSLDSVDDPDLARRLARIAEEERLSRDVMIEVNLGEESQKGGVPPEEVEGFARDVFGLPGLRLTGLMGVPPFEGEPEASRPHFKTLAALFSKVRESCPDPAVFAQVSMGMSHDFEVAVEEGATLVRLGTALYGPRRTA
jgi:PLP dependent protein